MPYRRSYLHFLKAPDVDVLRAALAGLFAIHSDAVFVYTDAVAVFGSADREADPALVAAYDASLVHVLLQFYQPRTGPIAGWLSVETKREDVGARTLARALAAATASPFYYDDPAPDHRAGPNNEGAQIEVDPSGRERPVWLVEYGGPHGATLTDLSDRETR